MAVLLTKEQIKEIIPHRDPFLLIDEVNEMEAGVSCVATKYIKENDYWFEGHFPGYPVTPGVLQIEMLAQAGAVTLMYLPENRGKIGLFAGIDKVKFRRQVVPGDVLRLETQITRKVGSIVIATGKATVNGEVAATAEMKFALADTKKD